jgi:thiol-disulfide isomerase/thioredoxin
MRRAAAGLVLLLAGLTACSNGHAPSYDATKTLKVQTPDLVAMKKHSLVPDCPKVAKTSVADGLPAVTLPCLGGGRSVDMAGLRGPLLLNFWASWCGSCRAEMPALAAFARSQSAVKVIGIDFLDSSPSKALELATSSRVGYPLLSDPDGLLDRRKPLPHISGMPTTVFIDAQGRIARVEPKPYTSEQDVVDAARKYLGTPG